jgi:pimeloyl-ACP methyl ester carboxylesterase
MRRSYDTLVRQLVDCGFLCLALDLRGHGDSALDPNGKPLVLDGPILDDPGRNPFFLMHADAHAGLNLLVERGAPAGSLGVVGAGGGAAVALHTAVEHGAMVHAMVLLSPGINACGLPADLYAGRQRNRPCLIFASAEEKELAPSKVAAACDASLTRFTVLEERGVHGTGVFGRVPGIEAEISEFCLNSLGQGPAWEIPWCRDVILDGSVETEEGLSALKMPIELNDGAIANVRFARDRRRLIVGVSIPERYIRRNEVTVYVDRDPRGRAISESSLKISVSPNNPEQPAEQIWFGKSGVWSEEKLDGVRTYSNTRNKDNWSTEIAIPLSFFGADEKQSFKGRIGVRVRGQRDEELNYLPDSKNLDQSPRTWHEVVIAPIK